MDFLKEKILNEGFVIDNHILKVDGFINHQVDSTLISRIGMEFADYFSKKDVTKVVTIESSGIAPAIMTALNLNVPMVIFKKQTSKILDDNFYQTNVFSYTKSVSYNLTVSKKYITKDDNILIIDDFLANGEAANGAIRLIKEAHANVAGIGIIIEKSFQPGRQKLLDLGYEVYSLARIQSLNNNTIKFVE